ncbi:MAG TPA: ribosome silencing factor [bacterium]|jgi:ribosome-associated protein|nr:ribosome silencing factor [bacterium]
MTTKGKDLIPHTVAQMIEALDEKKAADILLLDMRDIASYTDYILICTATSSTHSNALIDNVEEHVRHAIKPIYRNSSKDKNWLILDYGEAVVHVFNETSRMYYDLERLWGDAKRIDWAKIGKTSKT